MLTNNARCNPTRPLKAQAALWGALLLGLATPAVPAESFPVLFRVDAAKSQGDLKPIWRFFGADEPNYANMQHGRRLLGELGGLAPDQGFFRAHRGWVHCRSRPRSNPPRSRGLANWPRSAPPEAVRAENGAALLTFRLPRRGVSLLVLEWGHPPPD